MATIVPAELALILSSDGRTSPRVTLGLHLTPLVTWRIELCNDCSQRSRELVALTERVTDEAGARDQG